VDGGQNEGLDVPTTLSDPSREKKSKICDERTVMMPLLPPTIGSKLWKTTSALFFGDSTRSVMITEKNTTIMYAAMKPSKSGRYLTR
jgi:hypothetical protein